MGRSAPSTESVEQIRLNRIDKGPAHRGVWHRFSRQSKKPPGVRLTSKVFRYACQSRLGLWAGHRSFKNGPANIGRWGIRRIWRVVSGCRNIFTRCIRILLRIRMQGRAGRVAALGPGPPGPWTFPNARRVHMKLFVRSYEIRSCLVLLPSSHVSLLS